MNNTKESKANEQQILANIYSTIAMILIKDRGYRGTEVAKLLYKNKACISQYMNRVRGSNINFSDEVNNAIKKLADILDSNNGLPEYDLIKRIYDIVLLHHLNNDEQESLIEAA